jgi:hypothetical protein
MPILVTLFPALLKAHFSEKYVKIDKFYGNLRGGGPGPSTVLFVGPVFR